MTHATDARPSRPVPGPVREYHFPKVQRFSLGNGLTVVVAPLSRLPIATVLAVVDAGAAWDPPGREGLAQLVAKLLLEGAGTLDGAALIERFEQLGATVESSADWDTAVLSMTVTSPRFVPAFALFAEVLRRPAFRDRELDRLKAERRAELLQLRAEPRGLADEAFGSALYDPSSRYAIADGGSEATTQSIGRTDVTTLYSSRYTPPTTTLIVAGDVTADDVMSLAHTHLDDWAGVAARGEPTTDMAARTTRATHLIGRSDAQQSELRIGHVGVPRSHPDYFDIVVMNAILGGLFNSRINMNLREVHGYSYSAFSAFSWRRAAGPFTVSTAVQSDATGAAIREILGEIDRIRAEPVSADELSLATSYLDGVFPIRYETTAAVSGALANQIVYRLPEAYFETYRSRIRAVTIDSILNAARVHLHPDRLQSVVVGDPTLVRNQLAGQDFGTLIDVDHPSEARSGSPP